MRIRLSEIPEEGKSFQWNRKTGELNAVMADLISDRPHDAEFFIQPINAHNFQLLGTLKSAAPEQCSRCGLDFDFDIDLKYQEILIPKQPDDRTGRYARVNHVSETEQGGPDVTEYDADLTFDMGEYLHEQAALQVPFNPAPPETESGDCRKCGIAVRGRSFGYDETLPEEKPMNPFAVLKGLKVDRP